MEYKIGDKVLVEALIDGTCKTDGEYDICLKGYKTESFRVHKVYPFPKIRREDDTKPVRLGKWLIDEYEYYDCSLCGESYYNGCNSHQEAEERLKYRQYDVYAYCPHCGAKMENGGGEKE